MPSRRCRSNASRRRSAGREAATRIYEACGTQSLTERPPSAHAHFPQFQNLRKGQRTPRTFIDILGRIAVDAFAFEVIGMVMIGLCLIVLAIPSGRRRSRHIRYE